MKFRLENIDELEEKPGSKKPGAVMDIRQAAEYLGFSYYKTMQLAKEGAFGKVVVARRRKFTVLKDRVRQYKWDLYHGDGE